MEDLAHAGPEGLATCERLFEQAVDQSDLRYSLDSVELGPPLRYPSQIVAIGRNYADHTSEARAALPELPRLFAKWPSTVVGPGADILKPSRTAQLDWEVELAVVMGRHTRAVPPAEALNAVFGYTILNDVSARDIQFSKPEQLTLAKNFRTFTPLGGSLVTADEVPDPGSVTVRSWLNGTLMQDSSTKYLIFDVPSLISFVSNVTDLYPGDIISTGTPSGVGYFRDPPVFLNDGDQLRMQLLLGDDVLCELTNPVANA